MLALIQRVSRAQVRVDGETIGAIDDGLLALVAIESADGEAQAQRMCDRLLGYRVFADANGKMNHSLTDTGGGLLLVSQFTLAADTGKGMRPGFSVAAAPEHGLRYYNRLVEIARERHTGAADRLVGSRLVSRSPVGSRLVESGRFGAHMEVELVNDGPVTFLLRA